MYPCLKEFGVEPTEGYVSNECQIGDYGPYKQSERKEIYQAFCKELVAKGLAYPCFCSGDDEDDENDYRKEQKRLGVQTGYYGMWAKCRNLSLEEIEEAGLGNYFTDHGKGVYPVDASGNPFSALTFNSTGDVLADISEDIAAEEKARATYENLIDLTDDESLRGPLLFLRQREIVHFNRFKELYDYYKKELKR